MSNGRHLNVEQRYDGQPCSGRSGHLYSYLCERVWYFTGFDTGSDRHGHSTGSTNSGSEQDGTLRSRDGNAYSYLQRRHRTME